MDYHHDGLPISVGTVTPLNAAVEHCRGVVATLRIPLLYAKKLSLGISVLKQSEWACSDIVYVFLSHDKEWTHIAHIAKLLNNFLHSFLSYCGKSDFALLISKFPTITLREKIGYHQHRNLGARAGAHTEISFGESYS